MNGGAREIWKLCYRESVREGKYEREKVLDGECVRGRIRAEQGGIV